MSLLEKESCYFSDETIALAKQIMIAGIKDPELAIEMAISQLGDERAFNII